MAVQKSHRSKNKKTLNNMKTKILKNIATANIYFQNNKYKLKLIKSTTTNILK